MTGPINYTTEAEQHLQDPDETADDLAVNILGIFHGGEDWEAALSEEQVDPEAGR